MIRDDFMELYEALAQMGFRLVINTNGSLVTDEILDLFRRYPPGRVNVSMYGASEETYGGSAESGDGIGWQRPYRI